MSKYNYVSEDEHTFKVRHPDGSEFSIAKNAVGQGVHKQIKALKMYDGGIVEKESKESLGQNEFDKIIADSSLAPILPPQDNLSDMPTITPAEELAPSFLSRGSVRMGEDGKVTMPIPSAESLGKGLVKVSGTQPAQREIAQTPVPTAAMPEQAPAPVLTETPEPQAQVSPYADAFALQDSGINDLARASEMKAQRQAQVYEQEEKEINDIRVQHQSERDMVQAEINTLRSAVEKSEIDPNRLYQNMGTGNKILAAISVALGGIGAGLSGKPDSNIALSVIDKAIERDIESQKADLGKKQTLLSENYKRYGDINTAQQMTMAQLRAVTSAKISKIAAQSGSLEAQGIAKGLRAQNEFKAAEMMEKVAQSNMQARAINALASGKSNITDAQLQLPMFEKVRDRAIKINGRYQLANNEKLVSNATELVGATDALISNLDEIVALREKYGSESIPGPVKARMEALAKSAALGLKSAERLGSLDKGLVEFTEDVFPNPTGWGFVAEKYKQARKSQVEKTESKLKPMGLSYSYGGETKPEIQTKNGIPHRKVPGGWVPI